MIFATWLAQQLRTKDWTQADLARRVGTSTGSVSMWLSGERMPNPESCDRIADALGEDVDYVLTLAGHRPDTYDGDDAELKRLFAALRLVKPDEDQREWLHSLFASMRRGNEARESAR